MNTTSRLNSQQWAAVIHHASAHVHTRAVEGPDEGDEELGVSAASDPHANLIIDWYGFRDHIIAIPDAFI